MTDLIPFSPDFIGPDSQLSLPAGLPIDKWQDAGEFLAFLDHWTPWALGDWYVYGVKTYGAPLTIERLQAARRDQPECRLAALSTKTLQNYAVVCRAFPTSGLRFYNFWHCEAVMGIPEDCRLYYLEAGRAEEMSVARFRRFVAEETGRLPANGRSPTALAAEADGLRQANGELHDAVDDYADRLAEIEARADRKLDDDPQAGAEEAYRRDMPVEWVEDCPRIGFTCPACGAITTIRFMDLPDLESGAVIRCPECRERVRMALEKV